MQVIPLPSIERAFVYSTGVGGMMQKIFSQCEHTNDSKPSTVRFYVHGVAAGFPSPADDYSDGDIDLVSLLIENPCATFITRAMGDSMIDAGVHSGDLLIVNRSLTPVDGSIVVAILEGEFTLKRPRLRKDRTWLQPENTRYQPVEIRDGMDFEIWGVVRHSIRIHHQGKTVLH